MKHPTGRKKRFLSFILALLTALNSVSFAMPVFADGDTPETVAMTDLEQLHDVTIYSGPSVPAGADPGSMTLTTYLSRPRHPGDEIILMTNAGYEFEITDSSIQLGTEECPFYGTIYFPSISENKFRATKALFAYVSTDAQFLTGTSDDPAPFTGTITITRVSSANNDSALFADHVVAGDGGAELSWNLKCVNDDEVGAVTYAGAIGEIGEDAKVALCYDVSEAKKSATSISQVYSQGNVGLLCGTMREGSSLTAKVTGSVSDLTVTSELGAAGGLVGVMYDGAELTFSDDYSGTLTIEAKQSAASLSTPYAEATWEPWTTRGGAKSPSRSMPEKTYSVDKDATATRGVLNDAYAVTKDADTDKTDEKDADDTYKNTKDTKSRKLLTRALPESITPVSFPTVVAADLKPGYAGGLVGWAEDAEIALDSNTAAVGGTVIGYAAAGGVYGYYHNTAATRDFDMNGYTVTATMGSATLYADAQLGGVFGHLESDSGKTVNVTETAPAAGNKGTFNLKPSFAAKGKSAGGIVGYYEAPDLSGALNVYELKVQVVAAGSAERRGGVIGRIADTAAYVQMKQLGVHGSSLTGGLVGSMGAGGSFVDLREYVGLRGNADGGLIGYMNAGVLRLQGKTHMHDDAVMGGGMTTGSGGQLVYQRGDGLVYAVGTGSDSTLDNTNSTGWAFYRVDGNRRDDIGDWGEVLRLGGDSDPLKRSDNIISESNLANHYVTLAAAANPMSNVADFAKTALNIQLNVTDQPAAGALRFTAGAANTSATLLSNNLSISADVDLSGTGLTGLTRDNGNNAAFTATFNGNGKTVTLATGEAYGLDKNGTAITANGGTDRGAGRIYRHAYTGLFAKTTGATIRDLTVDGGIEIDPSQKQNYYIGSLVASASGALTLDTCTVDGVGITTSIISNDAKCRVGGAVGEISNTGGTVAVTGGSYRANLTDGRTASANMDAYFGGVIGRIAENGSAVTVNFTNTTVSGSYSNATATGNKYAYYGGLIGYIPKSTAARNVNVSGVTLGKLDVTSTAIDAAGGLLGYRWLTTNVTIGTAEDTHGGLTIGTANDTKTDGKYAASPNVDFTAKSGSHGLVGGLVNGATGQWTVYDLKVNAAGWTVSGTADFGFAAAAGVVDGDALYLALCNEAPTYYDLSGVDVVSGTFGVYDELVAYTVPITVAESNDVISLTAPPIATSAGAAVVSIRAKDGDGNKAVNMETGGDCNTYQNQTAYGKGSGKYNENSRYYYNIDDVIATVGSDAGKKLLLWSLNSHYAADNIKEIFTGGFPGETITGVCDMKGLSYYPVSASGVTFNNATVKFYNEQIEAHEAASGGGSDGFARTTRDGAAPSATQHLLMHSGILYNAQNLTVSGTNGLTLAGTVGALTTALGGAFAGSGFLVRGTLHDSTNKSTTLTGITLDNALVRVGSASDGAPSGSDSDYAPLLINRVGSDVASERTDLSVTTVSTTSNYDAAAAAATSLIGVVTGSNIQLHFSDMRLDGRTATGSLSDAADQTLFQTKYGTTKSVFTRATLLEKFEYLPNTNCDGDYNFNKAEDWDDTANPAAAIHHVTYGKEITTSSEFPSTSKKQYEYYDQEIRINPTKSNTAEHNDAYSFASGWLPYVAVSDAANNKHELKINQKLASLTGGCGKWDDPYLITSGDQLDTIAKIISGVVAPSTELKLPYTLTPNDAHTASGDNVIDNDATYTFNGTNFVHPDDNTKTHSKDAVRTYLAGAYYRIAANIDIPSSGFTGLGAVTDSVSNYDCAYAFRGVIEGDNHTVTNPSGVPLIANSNGSVVKNLRLSVTAPSSLSQNNASNNTTLTFEYPGGVPSYGAVIGKVMGGDNFIHNVSVDYTDCAGSFSVSGSAARLVPVGGMIGVVVNGGVVFRGSNAVTGFGSVSDLSDDGCLYVNKFIGRVIAGYAFSENAPAEYPIDNGSKNYDVPNLTDGSGTLSYSTSTTTVTVPGEQALWVLGAVVNSGSAGSSSGIWNARRANTAVRSGDASATGIHTYGSAFGITGYHDSDTSGSGTPYVISAYTTGSCGSVSAATTLEFTGACDMSDLPGFRGLGNIYTDAAANRLGSLTTVTGNSKTVTLNMRYQEYDMYTSGENYKANSSAAGFALFNVIGSTLTASDFTIGGKIFYEIRRSDTGAVVNYAARTKSGFTDNKDIVANETLSNNTTLAVGGLAGAVSGGSITANRISFDGIDLEGACYVGGLIGRTTVAATVNCCGGDGVSLTAGLLGGGLIGLANVSATIEIKGKDVSRNIPSTVLKDADFYVKCARGHNTEHASGNVAAFGGLVGVSANAKLLISDYGLSGGSMTCYFPTGKDETTIVGGAVGYIKNAKSGTMISDFTVKNVCFQAPFAGGAVGFNYGGNALTLKNVTVSGTAGESYIRAHRIAGGLLGMQRKSVNVESCVVSGYEICVIPGFGQYERDSAGGLIGYIFNDADNIKNVKVEHCEIFTYNANKDSNHGGAGGLFGYIRQGAVTGNNILMNTVTVTNYQTVTVSGETVTGSGQRNYNFGAITGHKANTDTLKLVGLSIQSVDSDGATAIGMIGTKQNATNNGYGSGGYVVFADFNGACTGNGKNIANPMPYDSGTDYTATMPYVTVNPKVQIDGTAAHILTSDGVAAAAANLPVNAILTDAGTRYAKGYAAADVKSFTLSNYKTEQMITDAGRQDFAVLVLNRGDGYAITTSTVNSYLRLLTNTDYDFTNLDSAIGTVTISRMAYVDDDENDSTPKVFSSTSEAVSLSRDATNRRFNAVNFDTNRDSFTLIDVAFKDPDGSGNIAYHLYVPVFVRQVMEFDFKAEILSGTDYRAADYDGHMQLLENYGTPGTICFRYTYRRTNSEWVAALEAGEDLLHGLDKSIVLHKYDTASPLPADTELVLVDKQTGKHWYSKLPANFDGELELSGFTLTDGTTPFAPQSLSELLKLTAAESASGKFVTCAENVATAKAILSGNTYTYFRVATEDDSALTHYSLSVDSTVVNDAQNPTYATETYYLSIFTDADANGISRYSVQCAKRLPATTIPTRLKNTFQSDMILGRIYVVSNTVIETAGGNNAHELSRVNDRLTVTMRSTIQMVNGGEYASIPGAKFHSFLVNMTRTEGAEVKTGVLGSPYVRGSYKIVGGTSNDDPIDTTELAQTYHQYGDSGAAATWIASGTYAQFTAADNIRNSFTSANNYTVTITSQVTIDYKGSEAGILAQFPQDHTNLNGTSVSAKSSLTASKTDMGSSSIIDPAADDTLYFSEGQTSQAKLYYNPKAENGVDDFDRLGINPLDPKNARDEAISQFTVNTVGILDYTSIADQVADYTHLQVKLKLQCRQDDYATAKAFTDYFTSLTVGGHSVLDVSLNSNGELVYDIPRSDSGIVVANNKATIPIDFVVITGDAFETAGLTYSNYKVTLTVSLVKIDGNTTTVRATAPSRHVTYTNAKILPDFIS